MSATDNGRIDEIISALQFLGKEKLICYSKEIKWLTELKQRLANSEWRNAEYEKPEIFDREGRSNDVWIIEEDGTRYFAYYTKRGNWIAFDGCLIVHPTHWMPLPEEPRNK